MIQGFGKCPASIFLSLAVASEQGVSGDVVAAPKGAAGREVQSCWKTARRELAHQRGAVRVVPPGVSGELGDELCLALFAVTRASNAQEAGKEEQGGMADSIPTARELGGQRGERARLLMTPLAERTNLNLGHVHGD